MQRSERESVSQSRRRRRWRLLIVRFGVSRDGGGASKRATYLNAEKTSAPTSSAAASVRNAIRLGP